MPRFFSKAFRDSGMIRLSGYAVRGLPQVWFPPEQRVDASWVQEVFAEEIACLDTLKLHSRWFWSPMLASAIISLSLWPQTENFWRRLAAREVWRNELGVDGAGLLYELVESFGNHAHLTRRPEFGLHVFQVSLAVAEAEALDDDENKYYLQLPPAPDVVGLLEQVRKHKSQVLATRGFMDPAELRARMVIPDPPRKVHGAGPDDVKQLAERACSADGDAVCTGDLDAAVEWITEQVSLASMHPAALAAAAVTVALNPACKPLWEKVFANEGQRRPVAGRKPAADAACCIRDAINQADRDQDPHFGAVVLYWRVRRVVDAWLEEPAQMFNGLPRVSRASAGRARFWTAAPVCFAPVVHMKRQITLSLHTPVP